MYYLIKNSTMWGAGGRSEHTEVEFISEDKLKLTNILKERFNEALEDSEVEFINGEYTDELGFCCIDVDEISDELEIQYKGDGFDYTADRYVIVSDRNARYLKDNLMRFKLENIFKNEIADEWDEYVENLIKEYNLCVDYRIIDDHKIELWCYDEDLAELFKDFDIGLGVSSKVEKVFNFDEDYQPVGLDYGDYIETVELKQNGNTYLVPVYCAYNGCGADYAFAIFEAEKVIK